MPEPIDALLDRIPRFDRPRSVTLLTGGLTNTNYRVDVDGQVYVVRVSTPDSTLLAIDRDNEDHNARLAAQSGIAPPVFERLVDPPTLIVGFVPSETLSAHTVRRGDRLDRIAAALRHLHASAPFRNRFDMFDIGRRYLAICDEMGLSLPDRYVDHHDTVHRIDAALGLHPEVLVPCHNDLLAENLLDDGERIWIIDFEYSGNNEPSFELGNLAAESQLDATQLAELCAHYWGHPSAHRAARAELWGLVARYGWVLWAVISAEINPLDFDFAAWGMEKYDAFEAAVAAPRFERLLADAGGADSGHADSGR